MVFIYSQSMLKIFINFLLLVIISCKKIEIQCPYNCKCDFVEKYKRAICSNQRLITVESFLPNQTELLDLSYNQISHLDGYTFYQQNLLSLQLLNISHNKISQVHMNAFNGLNKLKSLDLSFNSLQYILIHWFWNMESLQELYLKGNNFGKLMDEPQFESNTLKILDLSYCKISSLSTGIFNDLINLEHLDLSGNYLIQFNKHLIIPLKHLILLKLDDNNSFSCNNIMKELGNFCQKHNIKYRNPCRKRLSNISKNNHKFQRIIEEKIVSNEQNSWIFDIDEDNYTMSMCNCTIINCPKISHSLLMRIINLSPSLVICVVFIYGLFVGILIGCMIQLKNNFPSNNKNTYMSFKGLSNGHLEEMKIPFNSRLNLNGRESLMLSEWNIYETTPVAMKKNYQL